MDWVQRLLRIDRRIIFLLVGALTLVFVIHPVGMALRVSPEVRRIYDYMEKLPEGSVFLLSMDFDPASKPELAPMADALLRHAFRKKFRVVVMTLWVTGTGLAESILNRVATEEGKVPEVDYVFLGFSPGAANVILNMGQDLAKAFPKDQYGKPLGQIPMLQGVRNLRDVQYVISLGAGTPGVETWYVFGKEKYGFELGAGVTAVSAAGLYPLLQTGQINGMLGGLRGGAEYETLMGRMGKATAGMDAQSATHVLIIVLILLGNIGYLIARRRDGDAANARGRGGRG
jgi:hypothetical protein